jgi:hypothetical protein
MTLDSNSESAPETETTGQQNIFSRLMGVYFSPGKTFRDIGRSPRPLMPVITMVVIGLLLGFYLTRALDFRALVIEQLDTAVAQGRITEEQIDQLLPLFIKVAPIQTVVGSALGGLFVSLIIAGGFKLISMLIGAENRFKAIFAVTIYTVLAILIISYTLFILVLSFKDPIQNLNSMVNSNLGAIIAGLFGREVLPKFLMKLAGWIDIFAIWTIALLAIGYSAVSRKLKTATAAVWLSSVYGIVAVIGSLIASIFS